MELEIIDSRQGTEITIVGRPRTLRGEMGWSIFSERRAKGRLFYRKKTMSADRWAKQVFMACKERSQWCRDLEKWRTGKGVETVE